MVAYPDCIINPNTRNNDALQFITYKFR